MRTTIHIDRVCPSSSMMARPSMPTPALKATTALELEYALEGVVFSPVKLRRTRSLPIQKSKIEPSIPSARVKRGSTPSALRTNPRQHAVPPPATDMSSPPSVKALKRSNGRTSHSSSTRYFAELVRRRQVQLTAAKTPLNVLSRPLPASPVSLLQTESTSIASLFDILILSWNLSMSLGSLMMTVTTSVFMCFPQHAPWCAASPWSRVSCAQSLC